MRQSKSEPKNQSGADLKLAGAGAATGDWTTVEGAWSQSSPWRERSSSRWLGMVAGSGLACLAALALGAATIRSLTSSDVPDCGSGTECNDLGARHAAGAEATAADPEIAARLFQKACDRGSAAGCNNLGLAYQNGSGVPQDYGRALTSFERACGGGFAEACSNQGALYEHGLGVQENLGDAQRLYAQACRRGSALGCSNLGVLYSQGRSVLPNGDEAVRLFAEACAAGSEVGCSNLFESNAISEDVTPAAP